jgi:hypothetical protein
LNIVSPRKKYGRSSGTCRLTRHWDLDSFTGLFYKSDWSVIKVDIMNALHAFWSLDFWSFFLVNQAYITLLWKKKELVLVKDFRPISLIRSFSKLLTKVLPKRISPLMKMLVQPNQSTSSKARQSMTTLELSKAQPSSCT